LLLKGLHAELVKTLPDAAKAYVVNLVNPTSWQDECDQLVLQLTDRQFSLIIILDEFDKVIVQENLLKDGLFGSLRAYGANQRFAWITCTLRPLHAVFEEAFDEFKISGAKRRLESDFSNIFSTHVVGLFEVHDVDALIAVPTIEHGVVFSQEEQQAIIKFGGRFPYFIQRACYHFFEAQLKGVIKTDEVMRRCLREAQPLWKNYWESLTSRQQRLLLSVVRGHPVEASSDLESLKDMSLIYEENGYLMPLSEEFGRFVRSREHSYIGLPVIPGNLLWKQYEVEEVIGRTVHSQVVKARDIYLERHCAIKLMLLNQDYTNAEIQRLYTILLREARILTPLEHKNIGKLHEVRQDPMGVIMPWVEGKSLGTVIEEQAPLAYEAVIKIGIQLADGLRYIHARGITHRDIKPNNIILTPNNEPVLIDFDIARTATDSTITRTENGSLIHVGTLNYSAFEQFDHPELVGPSADIFALGVVLYELITHERPYPYGNDPKMYQDRLPALEQRDIPDSLFHILSAMLSREPDQRPSASALHELLQACLSPQDVRTHKRSRVNLGDRVTFCPRVNNIKDRGSEAELRTVGFLYENLDAREVGNYRILVNYNFPTHGTDTREVDLLVINKFGVFLLDVKGWLGMIDAYDDTWLIDKKIKRENPVASVNAKARILHTQLFGPQGRLKALRDMGVTGLVVLVQGLHKFQNKSSSNSKAVVGLDHTLLQAISTTDLLFRGKLSRMLSDKDINDLYKAIYSTHQATKDELVENYRILKELSFGDLFDAYEAENINIVTQHVRLKHYQLLKLSQPIREVDIRQFKRSMEAVFSLGFHPNILISLNFFPDPTRPDVFYEVTELVNGWRLDEIMAKTQRTLSLEEQLVYLEPLCAALDHAHNHKGPDGKNKPVYHRNICPETIFVTNDNIVKLGDFDFAKFGNETITVPGQTLIEKPFTAPEVLDNPSSASPVSDIYALGVLWYFLACLPAQNPTFKTSSINTQIDVLALPEAARTLMKRMMAPRPFDRPQSAKEVLNELKHLRKGEVTQLSAKIIEDKFQLPASLQTRLNMIIQSVRNFWEQAPYTHFTNHGPSHSERIQHQKLAQLIQELPEEQSLNEDEIFIVSAAAWLYEIGMQCTQLRPVLDFDYRPGVALSFEQLQQIRAHKHLLTYNMIRESASANDSSLYLGLPHPSDDYTPLIAEVCRWCSDEPLEQVPLQLPARGWMIRVRLLVALLRLADQLYIDSSRVNLELLRVANLSPDRVAQWWAYQYAQILPINRGQIRFHYSLPSVHKPLLGHIRALIEPAFEQDKNPTMSYLWDYGLRLIPQKQPNVIFEQQAGFLPEMSPGIVNYLREHITPLTYDKGPEVEDEEKKVDESLLLVLDYENFLLQLGLEGYFPPTDEIGHLLVTLLTEARDQYQCIVNGLAVGHWMRPDLVPLARLLEARLYRLLTAENHEKSSEVMKRELSQLMETDPPKKILLVSPDEEIAAIIKRFTDRRHIVNAWISDLPEAAIYRIAARNVKSLQQVLGLTGLQRFEVKDLEVAQAACILKLDEKMNAAKNGLALAEVSSILERIEQIQGRVNWWQLWLINKEILKFEPSNNQYVLRLNAEHSDVIAVRESRSAVVRTLQTLSQQEQGVEQGTLISELSVLSSFRDDRKEIVKFLMLLKDEYLLHLDPHSSTQVSQPVWHLNSTHWAVVAINSDRYLPLFVLGIDHFLVREGYPFIHEHTLKTRLTPYIDSDVVETVYQLALNKGWVKRRETIRKHSKRDEYLVEVSLANEHEGVRAAMLNRDVLLDVLYRRSSSGKLEREALSSTLHQIRQFTLSQTEINLWLSIFRRDSIVSIEADPLDTKKDNLRLNFESSLINRLLGRVNVFGIILTLRIMGATSPDKGRPVDEVSERLAKSSMHGNKQLSNWVLEYAKSIRLVELTKRNSSIDAQGIIFLRRHGLLLDLDQREPTICLALKELVELLTKRRFHDGWVPRPLLIQEMEKNPQYGHLPSEYDYWLNQAIHRRKLLKMKVEPGHPQQIFISVNTG
jgi:serine/threonine protein kinase